MQGLVLSKQYYDEVIKPLLAREFAPYVARMAVGLVGEGSECYGFDDDLSQDHDWGAGICIWLTHEDNQLFGQALTHSLSKLPLEFKGYPTKVATKLGKGRIGVWDMGQFYAQYLGVPAVPETLSGWRRIPEHHLSIATNGQVFTDPLGEFTAIRQQLLQGYPEDIRKKRIAAQCMVMAQSGQYNYPRVVARQELVAATLAEAEFIRSAMSMVYLLNNRYAPFYKWMHKGMAQLPILGSQIAEDINRLIGLTPDYFTGQINYQQKIATMENIAQTVIAEIKHQGLSLSDSDFLLDHGYWVHDHIADEQLRKTNPWVQ